MRASTIYRLKRLVYLTPLSRSWLVHWLRFKWRMPWIISVMKKFGREADAKSILPHMRRAYTKFHWNAEEFFLFQYEKLTDEQRYDFCPEFDHNVFCLTVNNWEIAQDFRDKWKTYLRLKTFFKRECILVVNIADLKEEAFTRFISQNKLFLMKPLEQCCGKGIQKVCTENLEPLKQFLMGGVNAY